MPLQIGQVHKGFPTLRAEILAIADVVSHVALQQAGDEETLAAPFAHVGAVSGVPALVIGQFERGRKCFVAVFAWECHLAGVALHVSLEISGLSETFVADGAVEWFLATVGEHVFGQALQLRKALAALTADVGPRCAVGLQVVV